MTVTLSVLLLGGIVLFLGLPVFEAVFSVILVTPILAFLLAKTLGSLTISTYGISCLILLALLIFLAYPIKRPKDLKRARSEFLPIVIFLIAFSFFHKLCLLWPDFIAIGERLRDYAILSSVIHSPMEVQEPWMVGYPLNYYAYWYRFGHMLNSVFGYETWQIYHLLQSFTYALYFTACFRILSAHLNVRASLSFFYSVLICFGSNVAGIRDYFFEEPGWWGPSRVINGAINEFPAWSFILGDLHPHYLNLPMIPFALCVLSVVRKSTSTVFDFVIVFFAAVTTIPLWIYNANVWEVPIWLSVFGFFILLKAAGPIKEAWSTKTLPRLRSSDSVGIKSLSALALVIALTISLYLSKKNIHPPNYPIDFVKGNIARTPLSEFVQHFGIPIYLIAATFAFGVSAGVLRTIFVLFAFSALFFKEAIGILVMLLIIDFIRIGSVYKILGKGSTKFSEDKTLLEAIGLTAIFLTIVPEVIFLNDPYGSDIERMNTIFKIYSANWFFIHIFAFVLVAPLFEKLIDWAKNATKMEVSLAKYFAVSAVFFPITILMLGFFMDTAGNERAERDLTILPIEQGLNEINRVFKGAAVTIQEFHKLPRGVTLEAQGKPYDYTTHVATLSEHPSYLGWANHVNLLLENNPEVGRRERVSDAIYNEKDCAKKKENVLHENIKYVVFGPLEKKRHTSASEEDFSCMTKLMTHGDYSIYSAN